MRTLLFALLLSSSAYASERCNTYAGRDYPSIRIIDEKMAITVKWERYEKTFGKTITKPFGVLIEGAYDLEDPKAEPHIFTRTTVDGQPAIIFSSMIFFSDCP